MGGKARVAIVDDDQGMREALEDLVRSLGHQPRCFASAAEFLAGTERAQVGCLILDIRMPGMSGLDLQRLLVTEGDPPPVIVLSSFVDGPTRDRAVAAGAQCVLLKPISDTELIACIDAALRRTARRSPATLR